MAIAVITLGGLADRVGHRISRWAAANAVADLLVGNGSEKASDLVGQLRERASGSDAIALYVLFDAQRMADADALMSLLLGLRKPPAADARVEVHLVAILPHQAAGAAALAAAYAVLAELKLGQQGPRRKPLFHRLWVVGASSDADRDAAVEAKLSQWLIARSDGQDPVRRIAQSPHIHVFGIWASGGAVRRARILREALGQMMARLMPQLPQPGILRLSGKVRRLSPGALSTLYSDAAGNFAEARAASAASSSGLLQAVGSAGFWHTLDAELETFRERSRSASEHDAATLSPHAPQAGQLAELLALVRDRQQQLALSVAEDHALLARLKGYEDKEYNGAEPLVRAGRRAAADVLLRLMMTKFDVQVYQRIENRLCGLGALEEISAWLAAFADALDGGLRCAKPPQGSHGQPAGAAGRAHPDIETLLHGDPDALRSALLAEIEANDALKDTLAEDCAAQGQSVAIAGAIGAAAVADGASLKPYAVGNWRPPAGHPSEMRLRAAQHLEGLTILYEAPASADAVPPVLDQVRSAFFAQVARGEARVSDERLLDNGLLIPLSEAEHERRGRVVRDMAHAIILGVLEGSPDGFVFSRGSFDQSGRVSFPSAWAAVAMLLGNAELLADLQAAASSRSAARGDPEIALKIKLLAGALAKGALRDFDAQAGGILAREEAIAVESDKVAVLKLRKSMNMWALECTVPYSYKRLRGIS